MTEGIQEQEQSETKNQVDSLPVVEPGSERHQLSLNLQYEEETDHFIMKYSEDQKVVLEVRMFPSNFEKLTHDMIRTIKNYNLFQAKIYQEKKDEQAKKENAVEPGVGELVQDTAIADQSSAVEPQQS